MRVVYTYFLSIWRVRAFYVNGCPHLNEANFQRPPVVGFSDEPFCWGIRFMLFTGIFEQTTCPVDETLRNLPLCDLVPIA